jgi:hypothetical protein
VAEEVAYRLAAAREAREEVGVDLPIDGLRPLARWVTPPSFARRFDARFFVAAVEPDVALRLDPEEVVDARWMAPGAALEARAAGDLALWLPTACVLALLDEAATMADSDLDGFLAALPRPAPPRPFRTSATAADVVRLDLPSVGAVPGRAGLGWLVGRRSVVAVDPGDPDPAVLDALVAAAGTAGKAIAAVVVTRVDPDHAAGAFDLANRLGVPAYCGRGGSPRLPIPFVELGVGDRVPAGDVALNVGKAGDARHGGLVLSTAAGWSVSRGGR